MVSIYSVGEGFNSGDERGVFRMHDGFWRAKIIFRGMLLDGGFTRPPRVIVMMPRYPVAGRTFNPAPFRIRGTVVFRKN